MAYSSSSLSEVELSSSLDSFLAFKAIGGNHHRHYISINKWENVQAMIDADYEVAARLQAQEQEELTVEEKSKLFVELMDNRKKHFARLKAE
ncbi:hypothetical protein Tco_1482269 [Tanacetum coccineum]